MKIERRERGEYNRNIRLVMRFSGMYYVNAKLLGRVDNGRVGGDGFRFPHSRSCEEEAYGMCGGDKRQLLR